MSSDLWLRDVINNVPFATVVWAGGDDKVSTVLCRVVEAQQKNWEELCFRWLESVHNSRLLLARQLMIRNGSRGYLWNVSLFSNDFVRATETMRLVVDSLFANTPQQAFAGHGRAVQGKVEDQPEYQQAQRGIMRSQQPDPVQGRHVANARSQGLVQEVTVPLPGARPGRNVPTGVTVGAGGQPTPSIRGAYGIAGK